VYPNTSTSVRRRVIRLLDYSPGGERIYEVRCPSSTLLTLSVTIVPLLAESQKDNGVYQVLFIVEIALAIGRGLTYITSEGIILPFYRFFCGNKKKGFPHESASAYQSALSAAQPSPTAKSPGQRREFLWRERVKLEMQVHVLIARTTSLAQEWQLLQHKK